MTRPKRKQHRMIVTGITKQRTYNTKTSSRHGGHQSNRLCATNTMIVGLTRKTIKTKRKIQKEKKGKNIRNLRLSRSILTKKSKRRRSYIRGNFLKFSFVSNSEASFAVLFNRRTEPRRIHFLYDELYDEGCALVRSSAFTSDPSPRESTKFFTAVSNSCALRDALSPTWMQRVSTCIPMFWRNWSAMRRRLCQRNISSS